GRPSTSPTSTPSPAGTSPGSRCRATTRWSTTCPPPRPGVWRSTGCPPSGPPTRSTWRRPAVAEHEDWLRTEVGAATPDRITVAGRDLPTEIMGELSLTELAFLLVTRREPSPAERRLVDAVLVSLADHGLTPPAPPPRPPYPGAPQRTQPAS